MKPVLFVTLAGLALLCIVETRTVDFCTKHNGSLTEYVTTIESKIHTLNGEACATEYSGLLLRLVEINCTSHTTFTISGFQQNLCKQKKPDCFLITKNEVHTFKGPLAKLPTHRCSSLQWNASGKISVTVTLEGHIGEDEVYGVRRSYAMEYAFVPSLSQTADVNPGNDCVNPAKQDSNNVTVTVPVNDCSNTAGKVSSNVTVIVLGVITAILTLALIAALARIYLMERAKKNETNAPTSNQQGVDVHAYEEVDASAFPSQNIGRVEEHAGVSNADETYNTLRETNHITPRVRDAQYSMAGPQSSA